MVQRVHTGKNVSEGLMLFYKMRILSVEPLSCPNIYLESSYPHPAEPNPWNLALGRSTGPKPRPAVGKALLPHHTLTIIPGVYWAPPQTY